MKVYKAQTLNKPKTLRLFDKAQIQTPSVAKLQIDSELPATHVFPCAVCHYTVKTGDSVALANGKFCHVKCHRFIHRSGQLKDLVKPEGSKTPTSKQRESNIKYARRNIGNSKVRAILRKETETLGDNSLVNYLDEK